MTCAFKKKSLLNIICKMLVIVLITTTIPCSTLLVNSEQAFASDPTATVTDLIQPDAAAGKDTWIKYRYPTYNFGVSTLFEVGADYTYSPWRGLLQFDLSSIPGAATITDADFKLYCSSGGQSAFNTSVHRLTQSWTEGTGNGSTTGNGATWNTCDGVNTWTTAGGTYNAAAEATVGISTTGYYTWDLTNLAQQWFIGTVSNNGILVKAQSESGLTNRTFRTSDITTVSQRPQLIVTYTVPDSTAPTSSIDTPIQGQRVSGINKIRVNASDNIDLAKVEVYIDGILTHTQNRPNPYTWKNTRFDYSWNTAAVDGSGNRLYPDGTHSFYAKAYDSAGNTLQTSSRSVNVDNTSPTATITIQPDEAAGKDTWIQNRLATYNYGIHSLFEVGTDYQSMPWRGLLQFDLSSIPANAAITNVQLKLDCINGGSTSLDTNVHQITRSWVEGTGNGSTTGNGATWNTYDGVNTWATSGGDFDTTPDATIGVGLTGLYSWDLTGLAQRWLNGASANYGVLMKTQVEGSTNNKTFATSNYSVTSKRPRLEITYTYDPTPPTIAIAKPLSGENIIDEFYNIVGTINDVDFKEAKIEYGAGRNPTTWSEITTITSPVNNAAIATWDTNNLGGEYTLRITAKDNSNNTSTLSRLVYIASFPWDIVFGDTLGEKSTCGYFGEPVNTGNGNYTGSFQDISIPGKGFSIKFERSYNSLDNMHNGALGYGWTHSYEQALGFDDNGSIIVLTADGGRQEFTPNGDGTFTAPEGVLERLIENEDDTYSYIYKDQSHLKFNTDGVLTELVDRYGNTTELSYSDGKLTTLTAPGQKTLSLTYTNNHITRATDISGRYTEYGYNANGNLVSFTDLNGKTTTYTYDENHQLLTINESKQTEHPFLTNHYTNGKVDYQYDAFLCQTTYNYDAENSKTYITDNMGSSLTHYFDSDLRMTQQTDEVGANKSYSFNSQGLVESVTNENTQTAHFAYDANGNLINTTDTAGNVTRSSYDLSNNNLLWTEDADGVRTTYSYDETGKFLNSITNPISTTTFQYYSDGLLHYSVSADATTTYEYDSSGHPTKIIDPLGYETNFENDAAGHMTSSTDANNNTARFTYDNMGNILSTKDPLSLLYPGERHQVDFTYDDNNNKETFTDANNNTTRYLYDDMNNLVGVVDAHENTTTYSYNANYKLESVTDARGNTTIYDYFANNLLKSIEDVLNNITQYFYDGVGNLTKIIYPNGNEKYCEYNDDNLIDQISYKNEPTTYAFQYNPTHTLKDVTDNENRKFSYAYNPVGWITDSTDTVNANLTDGFTINKTYDQAGRVTEIKTTRDETSTLEYNKRGDLLVIDLPVNEAESTIHFAYDNVGKRTETSLPDGTIQISGYDPAGRVVTIDTTTTANCSQLAYTYDANGNILSENSTTYAYDNLNRLVAWYNPAIDTTTTYSYDSVDNLLGAGEGTQTISSFTYNEANQITNSGFSYNANGNMTADTNHTYTYDSDNRLTEIKDKSDNHTIASYEYDYLGRRIKSIEDTETTYYHYDGSNLVAESNDTGEITARYFYDDAGRLLAMEQNNNTYYYQFNAHGDVISLTDAHGEVVAHYSYNPWGSITSEWYADGVSIDNPFTYAGEHGYYRDATTGLYYLKARYYDTGIYRFLSADPIKGDPKNPISFNAYAYCEDNPINTVDPDGDIAWAAVVTAGVTAYGIYKFGKMSYEIYIGFVAYKKVLNRAKTIGESGKYWDEAERLQALKKTKEWKDFQKKAPALLKNLVMGDLEIALDSGAGKCRTH